MCHPSLYQTSWLLWRLLELLHRISSYFFLFLVLNQLTILPLLLSTCLTHQRKADSFDNLLTSIYLARSTRFDLLTKKKWMPTYWTILPLSWTSQLFIVTTGLFLPFTVVKASGPCIIEVLLSLLTAKISSCRVASQSFLSTCSAIFSSIVFTKYFSTHHLGTPIHKS